eukprot:4448109-Amphidinium_carterae.1
MEFHGVFVPFLVWVSGSWTCVHEHTSAGFPCRQDMCSAPGSKTLETLEIMRIGILVSAEPNRQLLCGDASQPLPITRGVFRCLACKLECIYLHPNGKLHWEDNLLCCSLRVCSGAHQMTRLAGSMQVMGCGDKCRQTALHETSLKSTPRCLVIDVAACFAQGSICAACRAVSYTHLRAHETEADL